jgi:hypothetical protein
VPQDDKHMAAVRWLIDGGDDVAARLLLMSEMEMEEESDSWGSRINVTLYGPRAVYDGLKSTEGFAGLIRERVETALRLASDLPDAQVYITLKAERAVALPGWREELLESLENQRLSNQGLRVKEGRTWEGLRFASQSEVEIAKALDRAGVLFFPLCRGRVNKGKARVVREPDFMICHEGRWGIIEVDGEPYHPPTRTTQDHERDRLFKAHGVRVIEHYDATRCYGQADAVVTEFLALLAKA